MDEWWTQGTRPRRLRALGQADLDTAIDPREVWISELWVRFRDFVLATEGPAHRRADERIVPAQPGSEVLAAYDAPFPVPAR